jgi:hypothetical protein
VIAVAALPHEIGVSGEKFRPLGLNVKASGGAAVFLVTLGFIYYMKDEQRAQRPPTEQTERQARQEEERRAVDPPREEASAAPEQPPATATPAIERLAAPVATPSVQSIGYYQAWTYCSACCPAGPEFCEQIGFGEGTSVQQASAAAIEQCAANGGIPQTCAGNVQLYSGDEEPY